ncbi:MAG: phosphopantetheine-binding protein [Rhodoglobus sp.]
MDIAKEVVGVLNQVLGLGGRAAAFDENTHLLGAIPELDSMAVVALITAIEDHFGILVEDDDIDGSTFATLGTLTEFVRGELAG